VRAERSGFGCPIIGGIGWIIGLLADTLNSTGLWFLYIIVSRYFHRYAINHLFVQQTSFLEPYAGESAFGVCNDSTERLKGGDRGLE